MIRKFILSALLLNASSVWAQGTISAMTPASALTGTEAFECVQSGTKKCTAAQIKTFTSASPTLVTPALGTPSSGTLTNATGLPPAGVVGTAATLGANTFTGLQTITQATANTAALVASGHSLTGSNNTTGYSFASTLNTTGANYDVFKIAATVTATGANTNLFAVYGGAAGATKVFGVDSTGLTSIGVAGAGGKHTFNGVANWGFDGANIRLVIGSIDNGALGNITLNAAGGLYFSSLSSVTTMANNDVALTRSAAATLQQGAANAAAPVAQTLQSQGSRAGTDTNVGGANYTVRSGVGTGTGALSSLILQSPVAVASGTGAQTQTTGLTINNGTAATTGYTVAGLAAIVGTPLTGARVHVTDQLTACAAIGAALTGGGAVVCPAYYNGTAWVSG